MSVFAFTRKILAGVVCLGWLCFWAGSTGHGQGASPSGVAAAYEALPLSFERNEGQWDARVKFLARGAGYGIYLTDREAVLRLQREAGRDAAVVRLGLIGGSRAPRVEAREALPGKTHYLLGAEAARWRTGVNGYARVAYGDVYPGVDLVYYGTQRRLEYDFRLAPGARPESIRLSVAGADRLRVNAEGDLVIEVAGRALRQHRPVTYQIADGARRAVEGRYALAGPNEVAFEIGEYDRSRELVIDPVLSYATYLGGGLGEQGTAVAVDDAGNAYVTGATFSTDFPATDAGRNTTNGGSDVFVAKINPGATGAASLVFSAYLGGRDDDRGQAIALDAARNIYLAGATSSTNFPVTASAAQGAFASSAVSASADGGAAWTPKGSGLGTNAVAFLLVDPATPSTAYAATSAAGVFKSVDGGTTWNPSNGKADPSPDKNTQLGGNDVRALAFAPNRSNVVYAATAGGVFRSDNGGVDWKSVNGSPVAPTRLANTAVRAFAVDPARAGALYAGTADGVFKTANDGVDWSALNQGLASGSVAALAASAANGKTTLYAGIAGGGVFKSVDGGAWTPANGNLPDKAVQALAVDPATPDKVYAGTPKGVFASGDGGATWKAGAGLSADTRAIAIDGANAATLYAATAAGVFKSADGGATWAASPGQAGRDLRAVTARGAAVFAGGPGSNDAFLLKLAPAGDRLLYATYLGGSGNDFADGLAVDAAGNAFVAGSTGSANFPLKGFAGALAGSADGFVAKIATTASGAASLLFARLLGGAGSEQANAIAVDASGAMYLTGVTSSPDFPVTAGAFQKTYGNNAVFRSEDGAGAWTASAAGIAGDTMSAFAIASGVVYAGNAGGVFKSTDNGATWIGRKAGLTSIDIRALAVDPAASATVFAGTPAGVFKTTNGGDAWTLSLSGVTVRALAIDAKAVYAGTTVGGLFKSTDGGATWQASNGRKSNDASCATCLPGTNAATGASSATVQAIALRAGDLFVSVAGAGVLRSADGGATWSLFNQGLPQLDDAGRSARLIQTLAAGAGVVYAGTDAGVFARADADANWRAVNAGLDATDVRALAVDPGNAATVYAGTSGGVFKSANGGAQWTTRSAGLTSVFVNALAIDPAKPARLYAGIGGGIGDAFLAKLSPDGATLLYATTFGGGDADAGNGIALAAPDDVFLVGTTSSRNLPTTANALRAGYQGGGDAFVARFNTAASGSASLTYATYLGAAGAEQGNGIAVNAAGRVFVTGATASAAFPAANAINGLLNGGTDAFVTAFDIASDKTTLAYSTFLGGARDDAGLGIAIDASGAAYVAGVTASANFPVSPGAADASCCGPGDPGDAFLARIAGNNDLANLSVTKRADGAFRVGQTGTYAITVRNAGPGAAAAPLRVTDALPAELSFVSAAGAGWSCQAAGQSVTCANPNPLAAGAQSAFNLVVRINAVPPNGAALVNSVVVQSLTGDPAPDDNRGTSDGVVVAGPCTIALTPASLKVGAGGGPASVAIAADAGCAWSAATASPFLTLSAPTSGSGPGTLAFTVAPNANGFARTGTIQIGAQTLTVTQDGATCTIAIAPLSAPFAAEGGTGSVAVTTPAGCAWQAANQNPEFLTITGGFRGTGSGTVNYAVAPNGSGKLRAGTLLIGGLPFTVNQGTPSTPPCSFAIDPPRAAIGAAGGVGFIAVNTPINGPAALDPCEWTVTSGDPSFLTARSDRDQSGRAFVMYEVAPNPTGASRTGTLIVAGQLFTLTQAAQPAASGCAYQVAFAPANQSFGSGGGGGTASVAAAPGCAWQAGSNAGFVSVSGGGAGNGTVQFTVAANATPRARAAVLTIAGQPFTILQSGLATGASCAFVIDPAGAAFDAAGGNAAVFVNASLDACEWTAASSLPFVHLASDAAQSGSAFVVFTVDANPAAAARSGAITIAGQTFAITQAGRGSPPGQRSGRNPMAAEPPVAPPQPMRRRGDTATRGKNF